MKEDKKSYSRWGAAWGLPIVLGLGLTGCYGGIQEFDADSESVGGASAGGEDAGEGEDGGGGSDSDGSEAQQLAPNTRFFRLGHEQWENTVQDLFYLDAPTGKSSTFRADPSSQGYIFDNNALAMEVDQALWSAYQRAALELAILATDDAAVFDAITPPDTGGDATARAQAFIEQFGLRAFRRPLEGNEITEYMELFNAASDLYDGLDPFTAGVRITVESMLQSPFFVYRMERSTEIVDGMIPLNSYEVASRLSYFLWGTMPDDELFSLAEADALVNPDTVAEQAARLLDDPRAEAVVQRFHNRLLSIEKFSSIDPSEGVFPEVSDELGQYAITENELFLRNVIFERDGGLQELFTSTETFVNDELARIYGLEGDFGPDFVSVQLDATQRKGLFTQVGFLAANASAVEPDPIHRGVFMAERMACLPLPAPPDDIPGLPAIEPGQTNRQVVEAHTEQEGTVCAGCHSTLINPFGFPFEQYDAIGEFRTEDNGQPVDTTAEIPLDGGRVEVIDALDLLDKMANSTAVHECYVRHWVEFASGRPHVKQDDTLVAELGEASIGERLPIRELLVQMVTSRDFLNRASEEIE